MPKLLGSPPDTIKYEDALVRLGFGREAYRVSGLPSLDLLDYWQVGSSKLYKESDVADLSYALTVYRGLVALGALDSKTSMSSWLKSKARVGLLVDEDWHGEECPKCGGFAVVAEPGNIEIWCPKCGWNKLKYKPSLGGKGKER
jgi:ribosomal protein S27AE